ncbi:peptide chain release factor 2 [candidate division KSB1 bacterium]|nr:peptide chain release factor 2 [candidate division KSB1 bacterium]
MAGLEKVTAAAGFWDDQEKAQQVMREISGHKDIVELYKEIESKYNDLEVLLELANDEQDEETFKDVQGELGELKKRLAQIEFQNMLGEPDDPNNALMTIHPGAGGTESQDWAQMLMRMYIRWMETSGYEYQTLDLQSGEEAGIKSVTIEVRGKYAYGYLKAEAGVHRLVRISPFDANSRRHTSFASVFVYPEIEDNVEIKIDSNDLRVDTYRASGAGGQHVNKTSSAVRITHLPTNIVVQCQSERSQHRNKESAMKILMARLYQKKKEEDEAKFSEIEKGKKDISWGSQIRSYVFHPYNMVKDHRTNIETSNVQGVMDGNIDEFIQAYLMQKAGQTSGAAA